MVEYIIYLTTVSGLLLLRLRARSPNMEPASRVYLTPIFNPIIFCCVAALIVLRSAIAHLVQALVILFLFGASTLLYRSRWWKKVVGLADAGLG
jgi:hypothetical protein